MVLVEVVRYEEVDDGLKLTTNAKKILVVTTAIVIGGIVILALFLSTNVLSSKSNNSASSSTRLSSYSTTNASHYNKYLSVSSNVQVYIPPQLCAPENCPPQLGTCNSDSSQCVYKNGYRGLESFPEARVSWYCTLANDGSTCNGIMGKKIPALSIAKQVMKKTNTTLCVNNPNVNCVGIAAVPPVMMGNNAQNYWTNPSTTKPAWGAGLSVVTGQCYKLTATTGHIAYVAITDRCGGYCNCLSTHTQIGECSQCVGPYYTHMITDLTPNCQCIGTAGLIDTCATAVECDWCAANNHPHFDVDYQTMQRLCGWVTGICSLTKVEVIENCVEKVLPWPPTS